MINFGDDRKALERLALDRSILELHETWLKCKVLYTHHAFVKNMFSDWAQVCFSQKSGHLIFWSTVVFSRLSRCKQTHQPVTVLVQNGCHVCLHNNINKNECLSATGAVWQSISCSCCSFFSTWGASICQDALNCPVILKYIWKQPRCILSSCVRRWNCLCLFFWRIFSKGKCRVVSND